ncbi:MAG: hypothetical protein ABI811_11565 [Acidobacteriota bacterium]
MSTFRKLVIGASLACASAWGQHNPPKAPPTPASKSAPPERPAPVASKPASESDDSGRRWERMKQRDEEVDRMRKEAAKKQAEQKK